MNPKDAQAQAESKVRLDLLEPAGNEACARALEFGAITKGYGIQNYLTVPISARVYLAAAQRHLDKLKEGEDLAQDSLVHHWGHILANGHIWLASLAAGTLVDDRGPAEPGPHSINSTEPSEQAAKVTVGFDPAYPEKLAVLLQRADGIVDQMESGLKFTAEEDAAHLDALRRDMNRQFIPEPTSRPWDDRVEQAVAAEDFEWASEEEREAFWRDMGRPVDPPAFSVGDRVRVRRDCRFRAGSVGEVIEPRLGEVPNDLGWDVRVRFENDSAFYFSTSELEREQADCGKPGGCTTCHAFMDDVSEVGS